MQEIMAEAVIEKHSVWDNYVPIVKVGRSTHVYLTDGIEGPSEYNELCFGLDNADIGDTTYLHINNGGGVLDATNMITYSMKNSNATIIGKLSGTIASAATVVVMDCDEIEVADNVQFMIHNYSGGTGGKGHEIKAYVTFSDAQLNTAFREIYKGFLTPEEMDAVIEGKDMWMGTEEVLERWTRKKLSEVATVEDVE